MGVTSVFGSNLWVSLSPRLGYIFLGIFPPDALPFTDAVSLPPSPSLFLLYLCVLSHLYKCTQPKRDWNDFSCILSSTPPSDTVSKQFTTASSCCTWGAPFHSLRFAARRNWTVGFTFLSAECWSGGICWSSFKWSLRRGMYSMEECCQENSLVCSSRLASDKKTDVELVFSFKLGSCVFVFLYLFKSYVIIFLHLILDCKIGSKLFKQQLFVLSDF